MWMYNLRATHTSQPKQNPENVSKLNDKAPFSNPFEDALNPPLQIKPNSKYQDPVAPLDSSLTIPVTVPPVMHVVPPLDPPDPSPELIVNAPPALDADDPDPTVIAPSVPDADTPPLIDTRPSSPYAYLWIIGAINEEMPSYKGFLWDVLISARILRRLGSTADFWLYVRLSPDSKMTTLSDEDLRLIQAVGIKLKQLDTPEHESFGRLVYDKFLTLNMTDYKRVMFLDADIMPLTNLDYLFHLSDPEYKETPTVLKPNFIMATREEPCNTGMFFVEPSSKAFREYKEVVHRQHEKGKKLPYPHFDKSEGWGYDFRKNSDYWEAVHKKGGNGWHWHASHSDQGLMYYLAKWVFKNSSIAIGDRIQNLKPANEDGKVEIESDEAGVLAKYQPKILEYQWNCNSDKTEEKYLWRCTPPYEAFAHFMGNKKPWQSKFNLKGINKTWLHRQEAVRFLWFRELISMDEELRIGVDVQHWNEKHLPQMKNSPLGYMAMIRDQLKDQAEILQHNQSSEAKMSSSSTNATLANTVAYAVSLIKCGDHQNTAAGLIDASLVLRHSIHQISSRNPNSGSKYDYKMYAIVHTQAKGCAEVLKKTGFEVVIVDTPLKKEDIRGEFLRTHIQRERCCGHDEFIKLEAYRLPEEIIVHVDIDSTFYKPMDILFDAILHDKDSEEGIKARNAIELERPGEKLPDKIGAFLTRDWPQVVPGKFPPGFQAGFLVIRRDPSIVDEIVDVVKEGNYTDGWGMEYGWGNKGYGGWVGAMAMQGVIAYYYDYIRTDSAVELNQCLYNHMGIDVRHKGKCRNGHTECEDCMKTSMSEIYSMHYTMCRKPWLCQATGAPGGKKEGGRRGSAMNTNNVNVDHCLEMAKQWHSVRADMETALFKLTSDEGIYGGSKGDYRRDAFLGHCSGDGDSHYLKLSGSERSFQRIHELYTRA